MDNIDKYVWYQEGPGVRKNQYTTSGVKLLNVANLVDGNIDLSTSSRYISNEEANGKYNHFLVDEGDLIIASSGIQVSYFDKKMGFAKKEHLPLCMNTSTIRFKALDSKITNIRYFMYFLKSDVFKKQLQKLITGSAQLNFGPSHLKKIRINMPEIERQNKAVKDLDKVQKILDIRKKQVDELDQLIKSQFVEMFGNVEINSKHYKTIKLNEICDCLTGGTPSTDHSEYYQGNIPWITTVSLGKNYIDEQDAVSFITQSAVDNSSTKVIKENSILFGTRVGVGKCSINTVRICTNQDIVAITNISKDYNLLFLKHLLDQYNNYFESQKRGATIKGIKSETLKNIDVPVIDIEFQNKFEKIVKQVDKQKFEIQKSIDEMQNLYESLMDQYFG